MKYTLVLHSKFRKEYQALKLDNKQRNKVKEDHKKICERTPAGKQLVGEAFPIKELKYRSWGFRIFYITVREEVILLSCGRKKDDVIKTLSKAIKRNKK